MGNPIYTCHPAESVRSDALTELALNLRWSWNHSTDEIWGRLDPELWELTQNPWIVLQTVSQQKLESLNSDPAFTQRVEELRSQMREMASTPGWFESAHPNSPLSLVAYFSMEYMLGEALPIYSGGLGNVAGDQLKAASDLCVPVVSIGLLYQQGYFRQEFDSQGSQISLYPYNDPGQLPVTPLREANGEWLRLPVALPGLKLWIRAWQAQVGRRVLYLLDTNDPANPPAYRGITSELYGGGPELRLKQELVLGIAGWRLLRALKLEPEVCHLNEGHAAFALIERARSWMTDHHQPFDVAMAVTRAGNLFTTHTAVPAGFDRFPPDLIEKYLKYYVEHRLGISFDRFLALGRRDANDRGEPFNMAYLAMRGSGAVNGVSRLHGQVSRRLFTALFPRWPEAEVPVGHVTNGVHVPTWESPEASGFWTSVCGEERWLGEMRHVDSCIRLAPDERIWNMRCECRRALIDYTRKRFARQRATQGADPQEIAAAGRVFDVNVLTLGFARRFATYKRPNLLLHDPQRLIRILTDRQHPVQLILAGKAHPEDGGGQAMIRQWNEFVARPEVRDHVVFLSDYDMLLTQQLAPGTDVWINTPRRPWEASGTSGMKVLVNGGLNLSELDGWWVEAYAPEVGWALGDGHEHDSDPGWDAGEAEALYDLLEREVIPCFYERDERGIPRRWVEKIRESMARLTPAFSASRTVREYADRFYAPAAAAYRARCQDAGKPAADLLAWQRELEACWPLVAFGSRKADRRDGVHEFEVEVRLGQLDPESVRVELYADPLNGGEPARYTMTRGAALAAGKGGYRYCVSVPADRPASDYTARVLAFHPDAILPLEAPYILWQR